MPLPVRGISYATHPTADLERDLRTIRDDLHCTTVMVMDADVATLTAATRRALELGLDVYVRPQLEDRPRVELFAHLAQTAAAAEQLRRAYPGRVTLLVGSEFSLTQPGLVPGRSVFVRLHVLIRSRGLFRARITRRLDALLREALVTARRHFHGPVTYAAAAWEQVDWTGFDVVGVNLYRGGPDPRRYELRLRALLAAAGDKHFVVTEFGCGAFVGADQRGPASFLAVNWLTERPRVRQGVVREESTQARYLADLIDLYASTDVHGGFVFTFAMPDFPRRADPRLDLDMAGFGVVAVPDDGSAWVPKEAFTAVATAYARLADEADEPARQAEGGAHTQRP